LEVADLTVSYGSLRALRNATLRVDPAEIVAVIGPNGAGKTTLLRAIAGELKPLTGEVRASGRALGGSVYKRARRGIAYVPEGHRTLTTLTVHQNLAVGAHAAGVRVRSEDFRSLEEEMFALFPALSGRREVLAGSLSGGEQQMLAISTALISRPRVLLIDELSLGLAPLVIDRLLEAVRELPAQGTAVLLVEQFADRALAVAERGYLLAEGEIAMSGSSQEILRSGAVERAFLG
jgi:branched-chain amino acid transport system ATP-binding protein